MIILSVQYFSSSLIPYTLARCSVRAEAGTWPVRLKQCFTCHQFREESIHAWHACMTAYTATVAMRSSMAELHMQLMAGSIIAKAKANKQKKNAHQSMTSEPGGHTAAALQGRGKTTANYNLHSTQDEDSPGTPTVLAHPFAGHTLKPSHAAMPTGSLCRRALWRQWCCYRLWPTHSHHSMQPDPIPHSASYHTLPAYVY